MREKCRAKLETPGGTAQRQVRAAWEGCLREDEKSLQRRDMSLKKEEWKIFVGSGGILVLDRTPCERRQSRLEA